MRRLAIFVDGTWNVPENNTNVWRLKQLTMRNDDQLVHYHRGIGTDRTNRIRGAFGKGINASVRNCYEWLVENYQDGDAIFVFGFSRGAYIARSLAGFLERCGLLRPGCPMTVREVFEHYRTVAPVTPRERWPLTTDEWLVRWSRTVPLEVLGIWDSVRYLDIPVADVRGFSRSQNQFHVVEPFLAVRHTYHALAIDEHRPAYRHELMRIPAEAAAIGATLNQTWFVGAHSNVGGGYRGDLLSMVPLAWMQARAANHGLVFREEVDLRGDEHLGPLRDSFAEFLSGAYRVARAGRRHWRAIGEPDRKSSGIPWRACFAVRA